MATSATGRDMAGEIQRALDDPALQQALRRAMATLYERRRTAWAGDIDFEGLRDRARRLKEQALARNDELLDRLEARVTAAGGHLVRAATAAEARDYIVRLATDRGVRTIAKSKSMTSEEVHLNHALEEVGIEVVETDLGERIIQLAGERPSHLIVPAIHKTKEHVIELFARTMGIADPPTEDRGPHPPGARRPARTLPARRHGHHRGELRRRRHGNPGTGRERGEHPPLVAAAAHPRRPGGTREAHAHARRRLHLPRAAPPQRDRPAAHELRLVHHRHRRRPRSSTSDGPPRSAEREFHLVVLDNGRGAALADPELRETLYCIRCGACLNACAPYQNVGGHVYGADPYPGGIGCAWTYITNGHVEAKDINGLCTTCSRCTEVCPSRSTSLGSTRVVKERNNREFGAGLRQRVFARADLMGDGVQPDRTRRDPPAAHAALQRPGRRDGHRPDPGAAGLRARDPGDLVPAAAPPTPVRSERRTPQRPSGTARPEARPHVSAATHHCGPAWPCSSTASSTTTCPRSAGPRCWCSSGRAPRSCSRTTRAAVDPP